jgi:hypothetical protein
MSHAQLQQALGGLLPAIAAVCVAAHEAGESYHLLLLPMSPIVRMLCEGKQSQLLLHVSENKHACWSTLHHTAHNQCSAIAWEEAQLSEMEDCCCNNALLLCWSGTGADNGHSILNGGNGYGNSGGHGRAFGNIRGASTHARLASSSRYDI